MALLPIPSGLTTSNEFASVQGFNASGAPVVVPKTNFSTGGREVLTADRNYYVRTDGNDSNTGLENTAGGAFQTIQKAVNVVCALDMSIYQVIIYVAAGSYTLSSPIILKSLVGAVAVKIIGDAVTPSNVAITTTGSVFSTNYGQGSWDIDGFRFNGASATSGTIVSCSYGNYIKIRNFEFNGFNGGAVFYCIRGGNLEIFGNIKCIGAFKAFLWVEQFAFLNFQASSLVLESTPSFSSYFAVCKTAKMNFWPTVNITGTATGTRYIVEQNGIMDVASAGATRLPGSVAGSVITGGQYL